MNAALVYDAIRTPRGKGKPSGSLYTTKPIDLTVGLMREMLDRNDTLDPNRVDDVVLGVVSPLGDQGSDIAKIAAIKAGLPDTVAGVQLNRFCASGLEAVNIAAQKVASGWEDLVFAGGVESMSRVPMGSDGGAWGMDPMTNHETEFVPQGIGADLIATLEGFTREDVDAYAVRSQKRAFAAQQSGRFANSVIPVRDVNGAAVLERDEFIRPGTTVETLAQLKPSRCRSTTGSSASSTSTTPATPRASSTAPRWLRSAASTSVRSWVCARAPASSRPRCPAPIPRSCSPAPRRPRARRWTRRA
jgi:acetyl-CoA C-acetyltransferase